VKGSHDPRLEFYAPSYISGTVEARNFKFDKHIDHQKKCSKRRN